MFEDDPFRNFRLEHSPVLLKDGKDGFALHICAHSAHINVCLLEIGCDVDAADGDKRSWKGQFSQDDLPQLALENLTHPFDSVFHGKFGVGEPNAFRQLV